MLKNAKFCKAVKWQFLDASNHCPWTPSVNDSTLSVNDLIFINQLRINKLGYSCCYLDLISVYLGFQTQPFRGVRVIHLSRDMLFSFSGGNQLVPSDYTRVNHIAASQPNSCKNYHCLDVNSSPASAALMRQWIRSALVQIMAWRLFSTKPLSKPMLGYCQLDPQEQKFSENLIKIQNFSFTKMHPKNIIAKCRPFCPRVDKLTIQCLIMKFKRISNWVRPINF